jgi:hypothetical protein
MIDKKLKWICENLLVAFYPLIAKQTNMAQTSNTGVFTQVLNWFFGSDDEVHEPRRILATGKWRKFQTRRLLLEAALKHPITALSQEDEGKLQAKCAFDIMLKQGYIGGKVTQPAYCLFVGAGRGSTQFTIVNMNGEVENAYNVETGYPKEGEPDIELLRKTALDIFTQYSSTIQLIVGFDSIFHVLKVDCPVVPDKGALPERIETTGQDFLKLGYLTDLYENTPMIAVRNFVDRTGEARKISFATGKELLIDLGSGNANLVDPKTGRQIATYELPADWMTNDESLLEVASSLQKLLYEANEYDAMTSEDESDEE